jgi:hypothetical protein
MPAEALPELQPPGRAPRVMGAHATGHCRSLAGCRSAPGLDLPSSFWVAAALLVGLLMAARTFRIPRRKGPCADGHPVTPSLVVNDRS